MPKIAVTDYAFPDLAIETAIFGQVEHSLVACREKRPTAELIELVRDADAVLTQFALLNAEVIAGMSRAKVIVRYGIGVDNVDLEAARSRGIAVCNIPDYCVDEVADHTLAFILCSTRQVVPNTSLIQGGKWGLAGPLSALQALSNLTVGVIGYGRIGRAVVKRVLAFGARVLVFDPVIPAEQIAAGGGAPVPTLADLLPQCDIVTPHCPSTAQTKKMFNAAAFASMKAGAILINVGRGDLVDTPALIAALQSGRLAGAALDVFDPEPVPPDSPLLRLPGVIFSAHIASGSPQAVRKLRENAAALIVSALKGEPLANVVNKLLA
jgi:D-3-phosphoglycerate dehydrogenase